VNGYYNTLSRARSDSLPQESPFFKLFALLYLPVLERTSICLDTLFCLLRILFEKHKVNFAMVETQNDTPKSKLKPALKKKSSFDNAASRRQSTGRRLSFSDDNGGSLTKVIFCCFLSYTYCFRISHSSTVHVLSKRCCH